MSARLIEGRYPNYDSVIPKDNNRIVTIAKNDFVSALKRVLPMGNANSELVAKMREILRDSIYENLNNDETVLLYDEDNCVDF